MEPVFPVVQEVAYRNPADVFSPFSSEPWAMLFESADGDSHERASYGTNRFSYIAIDPFETVVVKNGKIYVNDVLFVNTCVNDVFIFLKQRAKRYMLSTHEGFPLFQGGIMGFIAYDLCHFLEPIPRPQHRDDDIEVVAVGFYDLVHAFDHHTKKSWVFSSGFPHHSRDAREKHAYSQLHEYLARIDSAAQDAPLCLPQASVRCHTNFTREKYIHAVNRAKEYIASGDIFEVNIAQRFEATLPKNHESYSLYKKIKQSNPSPFSAYINLGNTKIISSSPERFIEVKEGVVQTRPIKGTRKRSHDSQEDQRLAHELLHSEKDRAENIMVVDLMRNDLSRVCEPDSVIVRALCAHEVYPHVHHLVSVVEGKLTAANTTYDLLNACFPGGSVTGVPKVRAMQIIAELEPHHRGAYCGSLFYSNFAGTCMDSSILIRTYTVKDQRVTFHGGGAVTIDSDPNDEYEETLNKVRALKMALES